MLSSYPVRRGLRPVSLVSFMMVAAALCLVACDTDRSTHSSSAPHSGTRLEGVVVDYVKDGDSFVAIHRGDKLEVRLFGIDAPGKINRMQRHPETRRACY